MSPRPLDSLPMTDDDTRRLTAYHQLLAGRRGEGRFIDDGLALKLLLNVQKYSLWFHDFSHADMRKMQHGNDLGQHRLLVTHFSKGDYIMRLGEPATFLAILLQGELGSSDSRQNPTSLMSSRCALMSPDGLPATNEDSMSVVDAWQVCASAVAPASRAVYTRGRSSESVACSRATHARPTSSRSAMGTSARCSTQRSSCYLKRTPS